ncbi:MAG: hypothetical protein ISR44_00395 [Rhodospirillales bacterium]|nr:hypothetical protein [Rhodospirillales bacterium]
MGAVYSTEPPSSTKSKDKKNDITINGIPPGAQISVGSDNIEPPGAGDSDDARASGPATKGAMAKDPNQGRGGHPTELGEKQGPRFLEPNDGSKQNKDGTVNKLGDSGPQVTEIKEDKPPRGNFGPSGSIDSGDRKAPAPDKGPKGGGSGDSGERLKEQIANIRERQEKQQKQQEEKERQDRVAKMEALKAECKAAKGTFGRNIYEQMRGKAPAKAPGPSGSVDSGERRPNLLDEASKPPASVQNARAFYDRLRGTTPAKPHGPPSTPDPRDTIDRDALRDIKAFDKEVAPEADEWEDRARDFMDVYGDYKDMLTGGKRATGAVPPTAAQVSANARMVEGLVKVSDDTMLAGLFADSLKSGSSAAWSAYADFVEQLGARAPDRVEPFEDAVEGALGGEDGEMSDFVRALFKAAGLDAMLPKLHADSLAYKREMLARYINQSRRSGVKGRDIDRLERMLDTDHKAAVKEWEEKNWGPTKAER